MHRYIVFGLLLPLASLSAAVPLLEDCSDSSTVVATLTAGNAVRVLSSRAGDSQTCYTVKAVLEDGKEVTGRVLGQSLPAIVEFEKQLAEAAQRSQLPRPVQPAQANPAPAAPALPAFGDFGAIDVKNKRVVLSEMPGKFTLLCFWSPRNEESQRELIVVNRLFGRWRSKGLTAVGISTNLRRADILDSMDDFSVGFPNVPDNYNIAGRHSVSSVPYTFVLNDRKEIVASGLHGQQLEAEVNRLMSQR